MPRPLRVFVSVAVLLLGVVSASADDAGKQAKVGQLINLLWNDEIVGGIVSEAVASKANEATIRAAEETIPEGSTTGLRRDIEKAVMSALPEWKMSLHDVYADKFSEDEIDTLIAFHKTSAGRKFRKHAFDFGKVAMIRFAKLIRQPVEAVINRFIDANRGR